MSRIFVKGNKDDIQTATTDGSFPSIFIQYFYITHTLNYSKGVPYPPFKIFLYQSTLRITQTEIRLAEGCIIPAWIFIKLDQSSIIEHKRAFTQGIRAAHGEIKKTNGLLVRPWYLLFSCQVSLC